MVHHVNDLVRCLDQPETGELVRHRLKDTGGIGLSVSAGVQCRDESRLVGRTDRVDVERDWSERLAVDEILVSDLRR